MDGWTLAIVLFDLVAIGVLVKIRKSAKVLPEARGPALLPERYAPVRAALAEAAELLALELHQQGAATWAVGVDGRVPLRVEPLGVLNVPDGDGAFDLRITLNDPERLGAAFTLRPRGGLREVAPSFDLADPVFDQVYAVHGPEPEVRARLGVETRTRLLALPGRISVVAGRLEYVTRALFCGPEAISLAVGQAREALERLRAPDDPIAALGRVALADPEAGVRARALTSLAAAYPAAPKAAEITRAALEDPAPEVRLEAALALGAEGKRALTGLVVDPEVRLALRRRALEATTRLLEPADAARVLGTVLGSDEVPLALAEVAAAELARGLPGGVPILLARLERAGQGLRVAVIRALGDADDCAAEPALLAWLGAPDATTQVAAAGALAAVGTPVALGALEARRRAEAPPEVQARVAWAIEQIRARHGPQAGRLSLSAPAAEGELGLAEAPGALSPVDTDPA